MMLVKQLNTLVIIKRRYVFGLFICLMVCSVLGGFSKRSEALCTSCSSKVRSIADDVWEEAQDDFDSKINSEFRELQEFIIHDMWEQSILPAMMLAAEQFTVISMQQAMAIGMFIDAESQMNAQRLMQEIRAKANKDYHPSVGMCEFGSMMKSLATTERRGEITSVILSQRSQDRQLGLRNSSGMYGNDLDQAARITQFKRVFCNEKHRGTVLATICTDLAWSNAGFNQAARARIDKDIDYFSLVDAPWNLKLDFTNQEILQAGSPPAVPPLPADIHNEDEEHILAMASNLYAHKTFPRIPGKLLKNQPNLPLTIMQKAYMDMRSIIAKRSVAENSFYAISAMKAESPRIPRTTGTITDPVSSRIYMEHILKELGVPQAEVLTLLGENPSYYAQMEILTKKLYQNPDFYTNLYDKPANVERKTVSLQAIKLMQKFDMFKSYLRGEASVSILLELALSDLQSEIEDQIQAIDVSVQ